MSSSSSSSSRWEFPSWTDPRAFWRCLDFLQGRKPPLPEDQEEEQELRSGNSTTPYGKRSKEGWEEGGDTHGESRIGDEGRSVWKTRGAALRATPRTGEKEIIPLSHREKAKAPEEDLFDGIEVDYEQPITLRSADHDRSRVDPKVAHETVQSLLDDTKEDIAEQQTVSAWDASVDEFDFDPLPEKRT
ncbi:hypothetical protein FOZ63_013965 [Perkinsus olseni]|uniref:Uncharacterized protein n=1 Tax=Perkinsus olseni TaxID=32597 RepID=A0A7J6TYR8_PEROL|nr:hypothetical protein FOZ63_013965 [Perkinsus olseni]